jgi:hypothetical protein
LDREALKNLRRKKHPQSAIKTSSFPGQYIKGTYEVIGLHKISNFRIKNSNKCDKNTRKKGSYEQIFGAYDGTKSKSVPGTLSV